MPIQSIYSPNLPKNYLNHLGPRYYPRAPKKGTNTQVLMFLLEREQLMFLLEREQLIFLIEREQCPDVRSKLKKKSL